MKEFNLHDYENNISMVEEQQVKQNIKMYIYTCIQRDGTRAQGFGGVHVS